MHLSKSERVLSIIEVLTPEEHVDEKAVSGTGGDPYTSGTFYKRPAAKSEIKRAHKSMRQKSVQRTKTAKVQAKQKFKRQKYQDKMDRKLDKSRQGGVIKRVARAIAGNQAAQGFKSDLTSKLYR